VDADLARGPARLVVALGITLADNGADLESGDITLDLPAAPTQYVSGPRTGVSGPGGTLDYPWRFWIPGDRTVSPYKARSVSL
jgi:DNA-3-methyladenine glycosylase